MTRKGLTSIEADAAPYLWQTLDFISDLHLHLEGVHTYRVFSNYIEQCEADALFILGDLFEMWVGDDVLHSAIDSFEKQCVNLLKRSSAQRPTFIMHGNRDFLLGCDFFTLAACTLLEDPAVLTFDGVRYCLSHGDAYCYADERYMQTRRTVRAPLWIQSILAQPLSERIQLGAAMRQESAAYQSGLTQYADLDHEAMRALLQEHACEVLIHGHTHRPAREKLAAGLERIVLSDWDCDHQRKRASVLRLTRGQAQPEIIELTK